MAARKPGDGEPDHVVLPPQSNTEKLDYTYIIGGILLWGLIGWGLDFLLHAGWIVFVGALFGAFCGYFLARHHRRHGSREVDRG